MENKRAKKKNAFKMPDPLPLGEILTDSFNTNWELGQSIGKGGFGEIYSAKRVPSDNSKLSYVIKIEPHENGPLFVEMHFYMKHCKKEDVLEYMQSKNLKSLGIPYYYGSGSHVHGDVKYRFLVIEKYGSDIWKLFLNNGRQFPLDTVLCLGIQTIDILEYIHNKGYIHGDIKGANLLLGTSSNNCNQVYLLDYGLAGRYFTGKVYKPDPKKAHNGTIEYLSIDAHRGVQTRRGDLEILLYNLVQWLGCKLPWEDKLKDVKYVQESKEKYFKDSREFFSTCFKDSQPPKSLVDYMAYLQQLDFKTEPDYAHLKGLLLSDMKRKTFKLTLKTPTKRKSKSPAARRKKMRQSQSAERTKSPIRTRANKNSLTNGTTATNGETVGDDLKATSARTAKRNVKRLSRSLTNLNQIDKEVDEPREEGNELPMTAEMLKYKHKLDDKKKTKKSKKTNATGPADNHDETPSTSSGTRSKTARLKGLRPR